MKNIYLRVCVFLFCGLSFTACETEQTETKISSPMVSYNEDFGKNQARLMSEAALEKAPISNTPAILDGSSQKISTPTQTNTSQ